MASKKMKAFVAQSTLCALIVMMQIENEGVSSAVPPIKFMTSEQFTGLRADTQTVLNPSHSVSQQRASTPIYHYSVECCMQYDLFYRSNRQGEVGFLSESRRINVSVTRARRCCVIIGDSQTLKHDPCCQDLWEYCCRLDAVKNVRDFQLINF